MELYDQEFTGLVKGCVHEVGLRRRRRCSGVRATCKRRHTLVLPVSAAIFASLLCCRFVPTVSNRTAASRNRYDDDTQRAMAREVLKGAGGGRVAIISAPSVMNGIKVGTFITLHANVM